MKKETKRLLEHCLVLLKDDHTYQEETLYANNELDPDIMADFREEQAILKKIIKTGKL